MTMLLLKLSFLVSLEGFSEELCWYVDAFKWLCGSWILDVSKIQSLVQEITEGVLGVVIELCTVNEVNGALDVRSRREYSMMIFKLFLSD
jgi:hypothetical protein